MSITIKQKRQTVSSAEQRKGNSKTKYVHDDERIANSDTLGLESESSASDGKDCNETGHRMHIYKKSGLRHALGLNHWELVSYEALPCWLQDNTGILHYYRPPLHSYRACFYSLLYLHNETVNIYTHFLGGLGIAMAALYVYTVIIDDHSWQDKAAMGVFFTGAFLMLMMSSLFHLVLCHSHDAYKIFSRCDYTGIAIMIAGSFGPTTYFLFYCDQSMMQVYLALIAVLMAGTLVVVYCPGFNEPRYQLLRVCTFVSMAAMCILPVCHHIAKYGYEHTHTVFALYWQCLQVATYLFGAFLYIIQFPERWFPGKFDLWLSSHQIMHIMIVVAASMH
eukprot:Ihof_evm1s324 gene=Ihof_evmTU1s324